MWEESVKLYWMPLRCLRVGPCEGAVPRLDGVLSGGSGSYSCDPLKTNKGASGVNASLDSKLSCTGHFYGCLVPQQACGLLYRGINLVQRPAAMPWALELGWFFREAVRSCNQAWDPVACAELVDSQVSCLGNRAVCVSSDKWKKKPPWEEGRETT